MSANRLLLLALLALLALPNCNGAPGDRYVPSDDNSGDDDSSGDDDGAGDDDDVVGDDDVYEGCSYNSLANVTFSQTVHYGGEDYTPDILASLVKSWDPPALYFPFPGVVTEFGDDPDTGLQAITLTEQPPGDDDDSAGDDDDSTGDDDDDSTGGDDDDSTGDDDDSTGDDDDSAGDDDDSTDTVPEADVPPGCTVSCNATDPSNNTPDGLLLLLPVLLVGRRRRTTTPSRSQQSPSPQSPSPQSPSPPQPSRRPSRRRASLVLFLLSLSLPQVAAAGDDQQAALQAAAIHGQFCAGIGSRDASYAANTTSVISDTMALVSDRYEANQAVYLLYWRALLGQCLKQDELAARDLAAFVEATEAMTDLGPQRKDAIRRLRQMKKSGPGSRLAGDRPRFLIGLGGGYQRLAGWDYGVIAADFEVRITRGLHFLITGRPAISAPTRDTEGVPVEPPQRSVLPVFGPGLTYRFAGRIEGLLGVVLLLAPNPNEASQDRGFLIGASARAGVEIPFGTAPLGLRLSAEFGFLRDMPEARGVAQLAFRLGEGAAPREAGSSPLP